MKDEELVTALADSLAMNVRVLQKLRNCHYLCECLIAFMMTILIFISYFISTPAEPITPVYYMIVGVGQVVLAAAFFHIHRCRLVIDETLLKIFKELEKLS